MTTARIAAAFATRLATWAAARTPPLRIAPQNVTFTPPAGTYLRTYLMPARTDSRTLDRVHRGYRGVWQVSVVLAAGTGYGEGYAIAAELDALFPTQPPYMVQSGLTVYVTQPMGAAAGLVDDDGRFVVPVSCTYEANE